MKFNFFWMKYANNIGKKIANQYFMITPFLSAILKEM